MPLRSRPEHHPRGLNWAKTRWSVIDFARASWNELERFATQQKEEVSRRWREAYEEFAKLLDDEGGGWSAARRSRSGTRNTATHIEGLASGPALHRARGRHEPPAVPAEICLPYCRARVSTISRAPCHIVVGMGRPKIYKEERVTTALRVPVSTHERLKVEAARRNMSVNQLVTLACDDFLERLLPPDQVRWTKPDVPQAS